MFLNTLAFSSLIYFICYLIFYNLTIMSLFMILFSLFGDSLSSNFKFNEISSNIFFKIWIVVIFLSLAGLPPFLGFTVKILLLTLFINSNSLLFFSMFFSILMAFLFFYIQNLKIILTENKSNSFPIKSSYLFSNYLFLYFINFVSFLLIFNIFCFDDFFLIINYII